MVIRTIVLSGQESTCLPADCPITFGIILFIRCLSLKVKLAKGVFDLWLVLDFHS